MKVACQRCPGEAKFTPPPRRDCRWRFIKARDRAGEKGHSVNWVRRAGGEERLQCLRDAVSTYDGEGDGGASEREGAAGEGGVLSPSKC